MEKITFEIRPSAEAQAAATRESFRRRGMVYRYIGFLLLELYLISPRLALVREDGGVRTDVIAWVVLILSVYWVVKVVRQGYGGAGVVTPGDPGTCSLDEEGVSYESRAYRSYLSWHMYDAVIETERFFVLERHDTRGFYIDKRTMSQETAQAIRELLASAPIRRKKLQQPASAVRGNSS